MLVQSMTNYINCSIFYHINFTLLKIKALFWYQWFHKEPFTIHGTHEFLNKSFTVQKVL